MWSTIYNTNLYNLNNLPKADAQERPSGSRTCNMMIASPTLYP